MSVSYAAWPVIGDVQSAYEAKGGTWTNAIAALAAIQLAAITSLVERETLRTWATSTASDRYFDGSGTGEMEIDEFVTLSSVSVVGYLAAPSLSMPNVAAVVEQQRPNTRISIFQGSLPALGRVWLDAFPEGRQNILVTAVWGYGATIPVDLWAAVQDAAATRTFRVRRDLSLGPVESWKDGETAQTRKVLSLSELSQYPDLERAIANYKRPTGARLRRRGRRMV